MQQTYAASPRLTRSPIMVVRTPMPSSKNVPFARVWRAVVAEFLATMLFIFFVAASASVPANFNGDKVTSALFTAFTQGIALFIAISFACNISGGHLNPAVTLMLMLMRSMPIVTGLMYIVAQFLGAIVGAALFLGAVGSNVASTLSATTPTVMDSHAFFMELVITSVLLTVVLATAVHSSVTSVQVLAPYPIGASVALGVLVAKEFTGASMNPARTFGPAVVANVWDSQWIYWIAHIIAAILVAFTYKLLFLTAPITSAQAEKAGILGNHSTATLRAVSEVDLFAQMARDETPYNHIVDIPTSQQPRHQELSTNRGANPPLVAAEQIIIKQDARNPDHTAVAMTRVIADEESLGHQPASVMNYTSARETR